MDQRIESEIPSRSSEDVIASAQRSACELTDAMKGWQPSSDSLPGYEIVREVHRGGQGVVYRATQNTTGRDVAIKVMRDGPFLGPRDKSRFDREVRILALLRHPNIVTIHDSGVAAGSHFFVMDYIPGESLDAYMSSQAWSISETLRLFVKICDAVHAAHLRGVIHRDLKPSNIRIDERGEPHVLDFGLAKFATEEIGDPAQWRAITMTGQFLGSLPWASPEQAGGSPDQIDMRTDVYSLGVILYHMLTERFPYRVSGTMRDVLSSIVESEPKKPSASRREIGEEVDAIVLKCLSKDPERRYQSAAGLAEDVRRYLNQQPVLARAPSAIYQVKKLVLRHKLPAALMAVLLVVVTAFAIGMSVLYAQAVTQRRRTMLAERATAAEAEKVRAVNEFLINEMIASAKPDIALGRKLTVEQVLENASVRIQDAFEGNPVVKASILTTIGTTYISLGLYEAATTRLREAEAIQTHVQGEEHPDTLRVRIRLVEALRLNAHYSEVEALIPRTLELCFRVFGEEHEDTLDAAFQRAWSHWYQGEITEALELHAWTLERRRRVLGDEHPDTISSRNQYGILRWARGETVGADQFSREALTSSRRILGDEHPETLRAMTMRGRILREHRRLEEAETMLRRVVETSSRIMGETHPDTLQAIINLGILVRTQARNNEASLLFRRALGIARELLGDEHPLTQQSLFFSGTTLFAQRQYAEALPILREALAINRRVSHEDVEAAAHSRDLLSYIAARLGQFVEAEHGHRGALAVHRLTFGDDRPNTLWSLRGLVQSLVAQGKLDEARPFAEELLAFRREAAERSDTDAYLLNCYSRALLELQPDDLRDPKLALEMAQRAYDLSTDEYHYNRYTLARAYQANGELENAIAMMQRALARIPLEVSEERADYEAAIARFLEELGDEEAAEQVYRNTLTDRREQFPEAHLDIAWSLEDLGSALLRHKKASEAEPIFEECLDIRREALPEDHWHIAHTTSLLGACLAAQDRFDEAEPLLLESFEQLQEHPIRPLTATRQAGKRLVQLYEAWGRPELAAEYKTMLENAKLSAVEGKLRTP